MTSPLNIEARQLRVFELIGQARTHADICKALHISPDTLARDLEAISDQVQQTLAGRREQLIAEALATYRAVVTAAWEEYRLDAKRERDHLGGKLDYSTEEVTTKTLAVEQAGEDGEPPELDGESAPVEVARKRGKARPNWKSRREAWLKIIIDATREITELLGIKKLTVEHGGVVGHLHAGVVTIDDIRGLSSDELRALTAPRSDSGGTSGAGAP